MEYIEVFLKFLETYGPQWAMSFLLAFILFYNIKLGSKTSKQFISSIEQLAESVHFGFKKIESPYMGNEESLTLFREFADNLVFKLLKEVEDVLERNNLSDRKVQIKKNLAAQFKNIVLEKSEIISKYHSKAGDMGHILEDGIDWDKMMNEVFTALFTKHTDLEKIRDIKSILAERLNLIIKEIEKRASTS